MHINCRLYVGHEHGIRQDIDSGVEMTVEGQAQWNLLASNLDVQHV